MHLYCVLGVELYIAGGIGGSLLSGGDRRARAKPSGNASRQSRKKPCAFVLHFAVFGAGSGTDCGKLMLHSFAFVLFIITPGR